MIPWQIFTGFAKFQRIAGMSDFLALPSARETFVNSFPSPEKFLFCTDKIESIEWLDLVPRLRIGDCFEIHFLHRGLCDLLLSSHQTFLLEVLLRQCVVCKEPLSSWFAISIFRAASKNTLLPGCHYCRPLRIWVTRNVCGWRHFCIFEIFCELHLPFRKVSQSVSRCSIVIPLFIFVLGFGWIAPVSWCPIVIALCCWTWRCTWWVLRWRCRRRTGTISLHSRDNERCEISSCRGFSSSIWSGVAFDRWPTHRYIHVLCRAFQVIELQACLRVIALWRRDQYRKHGPVPHR